MKKLLFTSILFSILFGAQAQDSLNMKKLSTWTSANATAYNDIWGYTANGREYAILGSNWGTHFIDITVPTSPVEINSFIGRNSNVIWRDFKVSGNYAYGVADNSGNSLQIFDLSNLPTSVTKVYDHDSLTTSAHNIFIEGDRIYLPSNRRGGGRTLDILSIANPTNPTLLGTMNNAYFGNCGGCLHDVYVKNDTAYCSAGSSGLFIYDLTNVASPNLISAITVYSEQGYNHASWVNEDYGTMVMADETHGTGLKTFDISDILNPVELDVFRTVAGAIPHNPFIRGTEAIVSYYHDGVQVFDISDPSNVTQKAFYDTYPDNAPTNHSGYQGDWGVYPFFPSRNIVASDISYGLFVLGKENDVFVNGPDIVACENGSISVPYGINGTFNNGNNFYLEISDTNGQFTTTQQIDTIAGVAAGTFTTTLPSNLQIGTDYKLRVLTTSPALKDGNYIHLNILPNAQSSSTVSVCEGDSVTIGSSVYHTEGIYTDVLSGFQCDSIVTTTVNIDSVDIPSISESGGLLFSTTASSYQWYLNGNILSSSTNQTLSYAQFGEGNFHVVVTEGNCSATSNIYEYILDGISSINNSTFSIYPNPSKGKVIIENNSGIKSKIEIINSTGQLVDSFYTNQSINIELAKGVYYIKIYSNKDIYTEKLIIE